MMRERQRDRRSRGANLADLFVVLLIIVVLVVGIHEGIALFTDPGPSFFEPLWSKLPFAR